jgi:hypothetical protein
VGRLEVDVGAAAFTCADDRGRYRLYFPRPWIAVQRVEGHCSTVMATQSTEWIGAQARLGQLDVYNDFEEMKSFTSEGRQHTIDWTGANPTLVSTVHVLVGSPLVSMATTVAGLVLRTRLRGYHSRSTFEAALMRSLGTTTVLVTS